MAARFTSVVVVGTLIAGCNLQAIAGDSDRSAPCEAATAVPDHIRTTSCELMRAVVTGMSDSPNFRRLVERVAALHGIVYFTARQAVNAQNRRVMDGTLQHRVTVAGSHRLLYATVTPYSGVRPVPIIAHELQHAIEVLESNAMSERDIDDLFDRIGMHTSASKVETAAALACEAVVAKELVSASERERSGGARRRD
jgi:hypothetical protein